MTMVRIMSLRIRKNSTLPCLVARVATSLILLQKKIKSSIDNKTYSRQKQFRNSIHPETMGWIATGG